MNVGKASKEAAEPIVVERKDRREQRDDKHFILLSIFFGWMEPPKKVAHGKKDCKFSGWAISQPASRLRRRIEAEGGGSIAHSNITAS